MASENFQFHYVYTKTGSISGQMVLRQTEDAINDLGDYIYDATLVATEALTKANQAIDTANTASSNASTALSTANSALSQVQTLTVTVNSWNDRITTAEGNAQNAVTTANSALSAANQAVETANAANTKSDQAISTANSATQTATSAQNAATQAVGTANQAVEAANQAISIANSAVTDTDAVRAEIDQALETVNAAVTNATTQAQNAAGSASQSESSAALAREWAIKMDGLVVDEDYSSKYYAQQAASSASAASGSAKAAAGSATAASKSETNAAQSATSAASSATAASGSATTAQNAATAAKTAQTAAEAARDEAVEAASANTTAVLYSAQKLTTAQQTQARKNVGAVGTSGNETVAGTKTFSNSISVSANPLIRSTNWSGVKISDTSHSASQNKMLAVVNDEDGKRFAGIEVTAGASGDRNIHISLRARDDSTWVIPWKVAELADGSIEESITGKVIADSFSGDLSGNADTATKLKTARTISLSGDATGSVSIDGSANATLNLTIANGSVTNGMLAARSVTFSKVNSGDVATQAEAEAGTANNSFMTPLRVAQAIAALAQQAPTGMLGCFATKTVPKGWLVCNGAKVSRTTYAALFAAIGTTFGAGDGSTTFTLPNLDGRFLECTTNTSQVGKMIEAGLPNITGKFIVGKITSGNGYKSEYDGVGAFTRTGTTANTAEGWENSGIRYSFDANRSSGLYGDSSTVQPAALRALVCIKS